MRIVPCQCHVLVLQQKLTSGVMQHLLHSPGGECRTLPPQHLDFIQKRRKKCAGLWGEPGKRGRFSLFFLLTHRAEEETGTRVCVCVCVLVSLYSTCTTATASLACAGNSVQGAGALPGCQLKQQQQKTMWLPPPSPSLQTTTTAPSRVLFFKMAGISQPKSRLCSHLFQLRTRELRCVLAGHVSV